MTSSGLDSLYKMQLELENVKRHLDDEERLDFFVSSMDDLRKAFVSKAFVSKAFVSVGLYPAAPPATISDTVYSDKVLITSLFGVKIYVDETLPANQMELRDARGQRLKRFSL